MQDFSRVGALSMRLRLFSGFSMLIPLFTKSLFFCNSKNTLLH